MNKLQEIYNYFITHNWTVRVKLLKTLLDLPPMLLHEFSHYIVAKLLWISDGFIKCHYFYEIFPENIDGDMYNVMRSYSFTVSTLYNENNKWSVFRNLLVSISPLYVIFILLCVNKLFMFWILFSLKTFLPSKGDILNSKNNLQILFK
jgi:hypothetical protein